MLMNKEKGGLAGGQGVDRFGERATTNLMDDPAFGPEVSWLVLMWQVAAT
jgi:hypothetical protein